MNAPKTQLSSRLYPFVKPLLAFVIISWALLTVLVPAHYAIVSDFMFNLCLVLLVISLFLQTSTLSLSFDWWVLLLLMGVIGFISVFNSQEISVSVIKAQLDLLIIGFGVLLFLLFKQQLIALVPFLLLAIVLIFLFVASPATLPEIVKVTPAQQGIWPFTFSKGSQNGLTYYMHIRHFSYHAFIASCCAFMLIEHYSMQSKLLRSMYVLLFAGCVLVLMIAQGRGSMLALLAFVFFNRFFIGGTWSAIKHSVLAVGVLAIILAISFLLPFAEMSQNLVARSDLTERSVNSLSSGRVTFWIGSFKAGLASPIFGHGPASYIWQDIWGAGLMVHPHNFVMQYVVEFGFLGTAILLYIMLKFFAGLYPNSANKTGASGIYKSLFAFVCAYYFFALFDGLFYHPLPMLHLAILVALMVAFKAEDGSLARAARK